MMHSASMTISQTEFSDFTCAMVDLLEDPGALGQSKDAHEAVGNIQKIRNSSLRIQQLLFMKSMHKSYYDNM